MGWLDKILQSKKNISWLYVIFIIGVMILGAGSFFPKREKAAEVKEKPPTAAAQTEERLSKMLEQISGVGQAEVMITFENDGEIVLALEKRKNTTMAGDSGEGAAKTEESEEKPVILSSGSSGEGPLILSETSPKVRGVIVAAEGGGSAQIKESIREAVRAVLGVPSHNIQVFKKR